VKHKGRAAAAFRRILVAALTIAIGLALVLWGLGLVLGRGAGRPGFGIVGFLLVGFILFSAYFFRDPDAKVPPGEGLIVAPAHGKVDVIDEIEEPHFIGGRARRISMFLSVFDVHVQQAPVAGRVALVRHTPGQFLNALKLESAALNENVVIGFETSEPACGRVAIKLITGIGESLLGRLMIYDALAMSYRTIDIRKDPQAPAITGLVDYEAFCGAVSEPPVAADASITPGELRDLMDSGAAIALIDVREPVEWEINRICGAVLIPQSVLQSSEGMAALAPGAIPVLYCKTGVRSAQALAALHRAGFANAVHLRGGIVAWAAQLEPDMAMY